MTAIATLYKWFSDLKKPNGAQFKALIDSFWHKSEKISMNTIDGLDRIIEGTASAQQLQNHLTDTHAHKEVLDKKVDKVPGKKLSTEDFTTELRTKLEGLQQVDTSGLLSKGGYTGTAQDLKNLIDAINRILQSDDTDLDQLQEIVTYIKQNKHILSTLGINNIAGLVEALAAKADKDHHHDERYAPITHHHNEYAHRTHRHNKDDIDGLPANIATTENVKTAIDGIQIGGRNYVLKSKEKQTSVGYIGKYWTLSEPAIVGIQYTFSCYASVEDGRQLCVYFTDIDGQRRQYIITDLVNGYNEFTIIPNYAWTGLCAFHEVSGVSPAPTATIEKLKFEKGNKATDWTPAPEDLIAEKTWEKQQHSLYGESLVTTLTSVQREVVIDNNSNSKNNLWTADNELNVGSRNVGGYAKINCNGYKLKGKDDNFVLTAGGGAKNLSDFDFYKGSIEPNDLNVFQSRKTGVYVVKYPAGWGTLVNFKSGGSTSSIEFLKRNWYAWSRIGVRNSVDDARFNEDNGEFRDLAWYSDVYRPGIIRYNWDATKEHQNDTVFVSQSGYIELNQLENLSSMSFRKVFSNGNVEFRCSGKQIIYTGDNQFNGKDGSTAVVSIYENKCYIDIRNI